MPRPAPARPSVEVLEARDVPAFGLDTTFAGGVVVNPVGTVRFEMVGGAAAGPNGTTVVAGKLALAPAGSGEVAVARVTAAGTPDPTFGGGDGLATAALDGSRIVSHVAVQADGKVVLAGSFTAASGTDLFVARLNANGSRDTGFGAGGEAVLDFGASDSVGGLAVQADGKVVLGVTTSSAGLTDPTSRLGVARLTAAGAADPTFGTAGKVVGPAGGGSRMVAGVAVGPDGRVVVGGTRYAATFDGSNEFFVARYTAAGAPDLTFGTGGRAETSYGAGGFRGAGDVALLADGRVVVGGGAHLAWFDTFGRVAAQERFGGDGPGPRSVEDLVALPGGGVRVVSIGAVNSGTLTVETRTAPGSSAGTVSVPLGSGGYRFVSAAAVGADGKLTVPLLRMSYREEDPLARGGALELVRFADPAAVSAPVTFVDWLGPVGSPPGTVRLTAVVRPLVGGGTVSGGTLTFRQGRTVLGSAAVAGPGTVVSVTLPAGFHEITAEYSGAAGWAPSAATRSFRVGKAPTAVEVTPSARILAPGQPVTLTATVRVTAGSAAPIGTVEFRAGARVLGTARLDGRGQAKLTTTLGAGAHPVTAVYAGSSTCDGSISPAVTLTTGRSAATTTTLTTSVAAPVFGQPQTLTARVAGATAGQVDFYDGATSVGSAAVDATGTATLTVRPNLGARRYRAVFAGTTAADGSASGWVFQTVGKAPAAVTLAAGSDGTVRATVRAAYAGSPIGTVTFKSGGVVLGTARVDGNGVATFRPAVPRGGAAITAEYGGSSTFLGGTSAPLAVRG